MASFLGRLGDLGRLLFGVWLLLTGLSVALKLGSPGMTVILGIILIASGVCFILGR
jgi:hypothetical protein